MRQKISVDAVDNLISNGRQTYQLGDTRINIDPLPISVIPQIIADISGIWKEVKSIVSANENNVVKIANLLVTRTPSVVAEMANVEYSDFKRLPAPIALDIALIALDVNMKASGSLIKNLLRLASQAQEFSAMWDAISGKKKIS